MFKILIGVVLGIIASYYAASHLQLLHGPMSKMGIGRSASTAVPNEQVLASNTINATPPNRLERQQSAHNIWARIDLALRLARLSPPSSVTQKEVSDVLSIVAQQNPDIQTLMASKTSTDLTNKEAIAMLSLIQQRISIKNTNPSYLTN